MAKSKPIFKIKSVGIYMVFAFISIGFVAKFVHETKGMKLEEMKG